nr:tetratricopeptide repeat protein [Rhodoferax sp.]
MGFLSRLLSPGRSTASGAAGHSLEQTERAERLILQGNSDEDAGDLSKAMRCYDEAIKAAPKLARAHLNRGNILQEQNRLDDALSAYVTATTLDPDYTGAHFNIGNVNMRMERHHEAISAYQVALRLKPDYFDAEFALAMAFGTGGRYEEAVAAYRRCIEIQTDSIPAHMGLAATFRALGRNAAVLEVLHQLLATNPDIAQAHCLAGDVFLVLGKIENAIASYGRALEIDPQFFVALTSMGDAQRQMGRHDAALASYERAVSIHPNVALLHMKLGNTLQTIGKNDAALKAMKLAVALDPHSTVIQFNAGNLYDEHGDYAGALVHYKQAIAVQPDAQSFNNLGIVQKKLGLLEDALASYRSALALDPECVDAHCNLGLALQEGGRCEQALSSLMRARQLDPLRALVHSNIALVLTDLNRLQEALDSCRQALELDPNLVEAHCNFGTIQLALGLLGEAAHSFERTLALAPSYTKARHNLSHAQLSLGQFEQGWRNYELRLDEHKNSRPATPLPQWTGQPVAIGDRVLVFVEQGLGDMLQFSRYLPLVAQRFAAGVSLFAPTPLLSLFRRSFPMIDVIDTMPNNQHEWQWQCPLMSLPFAFGTMLGTIPNQMPYLVPDVERSAQWRSRIGQLNLPLGEHRKIGIVWKPGTAMKIAHLKATTLQTLAPILNLPNCTWFSLQKEPDPETSAWVNTGKLVDWSTDFHDFDDSAALAVNLDLVISVDTSVAHLAGGLGLPTWLLNRYASDWRWMREREDSPWYPTLRIFAQERPGDWDAVASRVAKELATWHPSPVAKVEVPSVSADHWRKLGNAFLKSNNLTEAARCYRKGIQANPSDAICHSNLGFVLVQLGQRAEAEQMLSLAVAGNSADFDALYLLGNLVRDGGELTQAITYYRAALGVNPDFECCRRDLCMLLVQSGQPQEARLLMDETAAVDTESGDYFVFRGNMHLACGEYMEAEAAFLSANQLEPLNTMVLTNLGAAQLGKRDVLSAVNTFTQLLAIEPENVAAYTNRATAFHLSGQIALAIQDYHQALRLDPQYLYAQQNLLGALTYSARCTPEEYLQEARNYGEKARLLAKPYTSWQCHLQPVGARPLRVGFVSGDLRMHPVGYFLESILSCMDQVDIACIAYSNAVVEDAFSKHLQTVFSEWHRVSTLSDQELAAKIHAENIDILVDLAGHTAHNRLAVFSWCAAPVQVSWLGYWASTGVAEVDYILVDDISVPPSETKNFSEEPWYLPSSRLCLSPPANGAQIFPNPLPALNNGYVTFASFQNLAKISDATLATWADVLAMLPTARLRLQSRPLGHHETRVHMQTRLTQANIDPARVDLFEGSSREEYLKAYFDVDIVLDTFPFPGGTTTAEALWMGVPTITLTGNTLVGRQGESMLHIVGLDDWIAHSDADYVRLAVAKASDPEKLAPLRSGLRDAALQSSLFDAETFAKNLTLAFHGMAQYDAISPGKSANTR